MNKFMFFLDGIPIIVYSVFTMPDNISELAATIPKGGFAIAVYPVISADFCAVCFDENGKELKEAYLPLSVLSYFFGEIRHLPKVELDILYRGQLYEISVGDIDCIIALNPEKYKLKFTKNVEFEDGIKIDVDVIERHEEYLCVTCTDADLFDWVRLMRLGDVVGTGVFTPALAVSYDSDIRIKTANDILFYNAIAVAVSTLARRGIRPREGDTLAFVNGEEHRLYLLLDKLIFYPNIKYLY